MNGIGAGLILFSAEGNLAMVEKLLEIEGINVNAVDRTLMTALHWAALKGHMEIVLLLLKKGADLHRNDDQREQSYSERQLYEAALERLTREVAAVDDGDEASAAKKVDEVLVSRAA